MIDVGVLRIRKGRPGVGRRIAALFGGEEHEVTCGYRPAHRLADGALVINYGRGDKPVWWRNDLRILNHWESVQKSANKLTSFTLLDLHGVPTLEWTDDPKDAFIWVDGGSRVFARAIVAGKKGQGITILSPTKFCDHIYVPEAPLYTKAYEKKHEFRVFVAGGQVIDIVQKKKMSDDAFAKKGRFDEIDMDLRNYRRGWVFAHEDLNLGNKGRQYIKGLALKAMEAVGLDYGAVDILYKAHNDMVVCETNSAPAMRGKATWGAFRNYFLQEAEG